MRIAALFLLCNGLLSAQQAPRGAVEGQITDPTGAVVASAAIKLTNTETGVVTSGATNQQGAYEIPYLNPGMYRLEVALAGFKHWMQPALEVRAGERLR